ncbi:hypothetical protein A5821_002343 [Enterococcus sp. 7F3_DIV0205]|uniref:Uncharacterized protein n=1 Tax=Candidatus Enterococcus palustris TaxID=1834189 RepID=A0AAQ3WEL7_9ENTE|nr:DUF5085 family protein [Enterococcus sp. 7F3_DIV0205]OTN82773.1 hypothetical protein A5821_002696 [Enterococcus sp. 7F3_DIV0205]
MKIEQRPLYMKNLINFSREILPKEWETGLNTLQVLELNEGLYQSGPLFFSIKDIQDHEEKSFTFYMPINWATEIPPELDSLTFTEELSIRNAVMLRQADNEDNFLAAREKIEQYAKENQITLEDTSYVICTDVFGEYVLDIYIPIKDVSIK